MCCNYIQFPAQRGIFPGNFWLAFKNYILGIKKPSNFILMNFKTMWHTKGKLSPTWHNLPGGMEERMAAEEWCCSQPEPGSRERNLFLQQKHGKNKNILHPRAARISSTHGVSASWCSTRIKMPLRQSQLLLPALWNSCLHSRHRIPC